MVSAGAAMVPLTLLAPLALADGPIEAPMAGHVYVNVRTGERVVTIGQDAPTGTRSTSLGHFVNEVTEPRLAFYSVQNQSTASEYREAADWGDVAFDTRIDLVKFAYGTGIPADASLVVPGLGLDLWLFDCDNGSTQSSAIPLALVSIADLQGHSASSGTSIWYYSIDLDGSGLEFEIGDTDGSYTGVTGVPSTGCDLDDLDGSPLADFGWSYLFRQDQATEKGAIGPVLVLPGSDDEDIPPGMLSESNAVGVKDMIEVYRNPTAGPREIFQSSLFFGGWFPGSTIPYASFYIGLYGPEAVCAGADYNHDASVDVLDFLDFIADFSTCDGQPSPCGGFGDPDLNQDGVTDVLDLLDFLQLFDQCT
jgi:hypothetical protein